MSRSKDDTAAAVALFRALEHHRAPERRLFDDALSGQLLDGLAGIAARSAALAGAYASALEASWPGLVGEVLCRTRAIDDAVRAARATGTTQVVIVGAGLDARAHRLPELRSARVWEVDLPGPQAAKRRAVARLLGSAPDPVHYLAADLTIPDGETGPVNARGGGDGALQSGLGAQLVAAGLDADAPALLLLEGVSQYLPRAALERILRLTAALAPGSRLVFTYVPAQVHAAPRPAALARRLRWITVLEPGQLQGLLAGYRLRLCDELGAAEHEARYLHPLKRQLAVSDLERVVVAERVQTWVRPS